MKKILFLITKSEFGGAQRSVFNLCSVFKNKYELFVAAGGEGKSEKDLINKVSELGVKTKYLKRLKRNISPLSDILAIFEIKKLFESEKPDIVNLNSSKAGALGSLAAALIKKEKRPKIIYTIGGWSFNEKVSPVSRTIYFLAEKYTSQFKNYIITVSQADQRLAQNKGFKPKKGVIAIPNGVDLNSLNFLEKNEARQRLLLPYPPASLRSPKGVLSLRAGEALRPGKLVGTIANLYKNKGLDYLIDAAVAFKNDDVIFIVIGEGDKRKNLERLIAKHGLTDKFLLLGQKENASQYLKAFDLFVLPSLKEGMPFVIIEAMAAGLPIVATDVGGLKEMIDDGQSGILTEPARADLLAQTIKKVLDNDKLAQTLGQNAQKNSERFNLQKMAQETEKLF